MPLQVYMSGVLNRNSRINNYFKKSEKRKIFRTSQFEHENKLLKLFMGKKYIPLFENLTMLLGRIAELSINI